MSLITGIKSVVKNLPGIRDIVAERDQLRSELLALARFAPPGHFYSPIPSLEEIRRDETSIFAAKPREVPGVNLRELDQLTLLEELARFYPEMPFQAQRTPGLRYYFENPAYSYSDAILLHCMIRFLKPKRIIEVGSGF